MKAQFDKVKFLLTEKLTLYPILTGILFLANELRNNAIFNTLPENIYLILIVLAFTFLIDFLSRRVIKNKTKAALIATSFIIINLFYQDISSAFQSQTVLINYINSTTSNHPDVIIIPSILIAWLAFTFFVLRTPRFSAVLNLYFNVLVIAFILVEITQWLVVPVPQIKLTDNEPFPVNTDLLLSQKPDIYYIILDSYTSSESLKKYWNFDNSLFEDSLKQLGFLISAKSKSDFAVTQYCLASYLNSSPLKLDSLTHYNGRNLVKFIRNNRLFDWLKANKYICFNYSIFDSFGNTKYYDYLTHNHFLERTIWYVNFTKLCHFLRITLRISQLNLQIFRELDHVTDQKHENPIFVYAHVMMPHSPFIFNKYGTPYSASDSLTDKQKYLGQLIYTNSLILKSITNILTFSRSKPIIVIQGDHGYRCLENTTLIEKLHEAHTLFYAIHPPDGLLIPDSINPSTTFKRIIDCINYQHSKE
jgi:hypothetical protein